VINDPQARARDIVSRLPPGPCRAVEIGVWRGANAARILKWHKHVHLILVDPWAPAEGSYATSGSTDSKLDAASFEAVYQKALVNLRPYRGRYTIIRDTSERASASFEGMADLVFIDGDHSYEGCARDIACWRNHTKVIGGHDFGKASFPGVAQAVKEAFGDDGYTLGLDSNWWAK
jgi:hypothetical protein